MRQQLLEKYLIGDREFSAIGRLLMDSKTTLDSLCKATGESPEITYCIAQCVAQELFNEPLNELNKDFFISALPFLDNREGERVAMVERKRIMKLIRSKAEDMHSLIEESSRGRAQRRSA